MFRGNYINVLQLKTSHKIGTLTSIYNKTPPRNLDKNEQKICVFFLKLKSDFLEAKHCPLWSKSCGYFL